MGNTTGAAEPQPQRIALEEAAPWGANEEERPLELQAGLQTRVSKSIMATLGVGKAPDLGYGMPVFRVFSGFSYSMEQPPQHLAQKDTDGDGLRDGSDQCPTEPEDKDGFQDSDGCPIRTTTGTAWPTRAISAPPGRRPSTAWMTRMAARTRARARSR